MESRRRSRCSTLSILIAYYITISATTLFIQCDARKYVEKPKTQYQKLAKSLIEIQQNHLNIDQPLEYSDVEVDISEASSPFSLPPYDFPSPQNSPPFWDFPPFSLKTPPTVPTPPSSHEPPPPQPLNSPLPPPPHPPSPLPPPYGPSPPMSYPPPSPSGGIGGPTPLPPRYGPSPPMSYPPPSPSGGSGGPTPLRPRYGPSPPKNSPSPPVSYPPPPPSGSSGGPPPAHKKPQFPVWCVAKPTVPDTIMQPALDYACGSGADCKPIEPNGPCYFPNTLLAHASYAFNSYFQKSKLAGGTCDFGGTAMLVTDDPSFDECLFIYK